MFLPESKIFIVAKKIFPFLSKKGLAKRLKHWLIFGGEGSFNPYHKKIIRGITKKGWVVYDVGANCGDYSALFLKLGAEVYAFEASTIFRKLYERFKGNDRIHCIYGAVGNKQKEIVLNEFPDSRFSTATGKKDGGEVIVSHKIPCRKLDSFEIHKPDFIKIDVEGMDYEVLLGARHKIEVFRPIVLIEANPDWLIERGHTVADIKKYFEHLNYSCQEIVCYGVVTDLLFKPRNYLFSRDRMNERCK